MFEHSKPSTTCTARHIVGWDVLSPHYGTTGSLIFNERVLSLLTELHGFRVAGFAENFLDHCMIFATVTHAQETHFRANVVLESAGFKKVFTGHKKDVIQREKDSGDVSLWVVEPRDFKSSLENSIKELKEKIAEQKKVQFGDRDKYPYFRLIDLKVEGKVPAGTTLSNSLRWAFPNSLVLNNFIHEFKTKYGYGDIFTGRYETDKLITFERLKNAQNGWKDGRI